MTISTSNLLLHHHFPALAKTRKLQVEHPIEGEKCRAAWVPSSRRRGSGKLEHGRTGLARGRDFGKPDLLKTSTHLDARLRSGMSPASRRRLQCERRLGSGRARAARARAGGAARDREQGTRSGKEGVLARGAARSGSGRRRVCDQEPKSGTLGA